MSLSVGTPEEFKHKTQVTIGMLAYIGVAGFLIGFAVCMVWFSMAEVGGVRSDFEKEDTAIHKEIDAIKADVEKLKEKVHDYH